MMKMRAKSILEIIAVSIIMSSFACAAQISVAPKIIKQGGTFTVVLYPDKPEKEVGAVFEGQFIPFYKTKDGRGYLGILGVNATCPAGNRQLEITATSESGEADRYIGAIVVGRTKFPFERLLFIPPAKQAKISSGKLSKDQDEISRIFKVETKAKLWEGRFLLPLKGRFTSAFGTCRLYNGKKIGDHRGLDIGGNPVGTKIKAANNGVVALVKLFPTLGLAVVVDHGQGIHTIYMHMSKTLVKVGDTITKGRVIGLVGNTGLSTGPHLHWGLSVHDTRVNPLEWANRVVAE
jgi:lysostaphin